MRHFKFIIAKIFFGKDAGRGSNITDGLQWVERIYVKKEVGVGD